MCKLLCYQRVFILSFEINVDKRILPMHCLLMFFFLSIKIVGYCVLEVSVLVLQRLNDKVIYDKNAKLPKPIFCILCYG